MLIDGSAPASQHHELFWLSATAFVIGVGLGLLQPLIMVGIGAGLYAAPSYVGLLFLSSVAIALLVGAIALFVRSSRPASTFLASLSACLAVGMIGGNVLAARLHLSFATPAPPIEIHPTGAGWTVTGDMVVARSGHTATLLNDGRVLVAGGSATTEQGTNSAELYDPATGTWSATGGMLSATSDQKAVRLDDGRVLVMTWSGQCELYDPATGRWSDTGSMLQPRRSYAVTAMADGRVLVSGGRNDAIEPDGMAPPELFDPVAGTWGAAGTMVVPRAGHTATLLADGRVLIAGGQVAEGTTENPMGVISAAELYDPVAGTWTATGSMSEPRSGHAAALVDGDRVLVAGGSVISGLTELYDVRTGTWQAGLKVEGWMNPTAIALGDGRALVIDAFGAIAIYDPAAPTPGPTARSGHGTGATATLLANGKVLFAGGLILDYPGPSHTLAFAHLYDPG
jgi:hypothetical protein